MIIGELALLTAGLFTGAALHVVVSEQPARLALDDRAALVSWQESYDRAKIMQGALAVIGFVLAMLAYVLTTDARWLLGGLLLLANWPWTLVAMRSVNGELGAMETGALPASAPDLIRRWGHLHMVRAALGVASCLIFVWAMN